MKFVLKAIKNKYSAGFTFVELLIIMILVGILSGIGVQYKLSTQEDKGKLVKARTFLINSLPMAVASCSLKQIGSELADLNTGDTNGTCNDESHLIAEGIDSKTPWGEEWLGGAIRESAGTTLTFHICYPLEAVGNNAADIGESLRSYLGDKWGDTSNTATFHASGPPKTSVNTGNVTLGAARCAQTDVLLVEYIQ